MTPDGKDIEVLEKDEVNRIIAELVESIADFPLEQDKDIMRALLHLRHRVEMLEADIRGYQKRRA
jgi:hypothetical protein